MKIKHFNLFIILFLFCIKGFGQYNIATNNGQTITTCSGTLTDTASGNYSAGATQVITIQSPNLGEGVCLDFIQWAIDYSLGTYPGTTTNVLFYDGASVSSPLIYGATGDWNVTQSSGDGGAPFAFIGPGMVCSSGGPLTIQFVRRGTDAGFTANISCFKPSSANSCNIDLVASASSICTGQTVNLTATGLVTTPLIDNNFNNSTIGTGWSSTINSRFDNPCQPGLDGSPHFWIGNNAKPRVLTSTSFDVSTGGSIYFEIDFANQAAADPCEGPDERQEGVYLQYSTNGVNWTTIHYFYPEFYVEGSANIQSWQGYYFQIPAGAISTSTRFRWAQQDVSTNTTDHWGLDNIRIFLNPKPFTITITNQTAGGTVVGSSTSSPYNLSVSPTTTTTYRATITDGTASCYEDVTITVNGGATTTIAYPSSSVANTVTTAQNITLTNGPVTGDYTATPAGLTINSTTGAVTPSTSIPGTYTISVPTACGIATTTLAITAAPCGSCATATCPIAGPYTNYTNATGAAHTSNCQTTSPNIVGPNTYVSYYTVVASTSGKIGAIVSNDNTPNTCTTTRTAVLYLTSANCIGSTSALTPVLGANGSTFYNPEWSGLTPGATYIMVVTTVVASGCEIQDQCVSYYQPTTAAGCTTCATATCTPTSIIRSTVALGQTEITTALAGAGDQLGLTPLTPSQSVTVCVPVNVPVGSTVLGFKQKSAATPGGCSIPSEVLISYQLKPSGCGATITPNLTNASSVASGFNPEWNNLTPGNYTLCLTMNVTNLSICSSVDLEGIGYYNVIPIIPAVTCQDYQIQLYDDDATSVAHSGTTFSCSDAGVYLGPTTDPSDFDSGLPFQNYDISITAITGNLNNLVLNRYDAGTNALAERLTVTPGQVVQNYFLRPAPGQYYKLDKTNTQSGTYSYAIVDVISGATVASGTWTITAGAESAASISLIPQGTAAYSGPGVTNGFDVTGVNDYTNDRGIGFFNPALAGPGMHTITYTWNNGLAAPNNCSLTRTKTVTVTGQSAPTTTNVSICTGTTAILTASAIATGATIKWYDASTGGNLLFTGNPFTTPTLTAATSYWVTQTTGGCESTRTQVTVSITPGTDATYTLNSTTCAPGSITFSSVSPAATTFDWISGPAGYTFPAGFTTPSTTNTNLTNLPAGTYCVDITSPNVAGGTVTTTLLTENFEANAPNWTINNSGGNNIFVINNTYVGGTCTIGGLPFAVPAVPNQGTWATAGPQSKYLHIKATTTCGFGCAESAFPPANANFCSTTSDQKFTLNTPLNTIGKTNVTVSFQYINKGTDVDDFGALEYSTNGGSTWTQAGANLTGKTAWFNQVTTLPAWNNQASLLFRFRWKNDASSSSDPPLCLDEIIVTAQETAVASCGSTKQECIVINPIVTPTISCGTSTINSVQFTWSAVAGATSYTATHTINGGAAVNDGTITSPFTISGLNPNDAVVITITPVGGSGTCFGSVSLTCTANACPTILTPSANQTLCLGGDPTALSVSTTFTGANAISFVYFSTQQTGSAMYTGGTLLGNVTPSTGTANYNPGVLGTPGSLPNVSGTYFLYAIANPTPAGATCRPFQEIRVVVNSSPLIPTVTTTAATCLVNGTASVSNYSAALNYTSTPVGLTVSSTGVISGFTCGTPYTITATNAATCSATSTSFTVQCQLAAPLVPTVTTTAATCFANGTATVSNYSSTETYTSTPAGLTVSSTGVISGFTCGTAYTITATNAATCSATSTSFTVQCQLAAPAVPAVTITPATCLANGTATVSNYSSTETYTSTPLGLTVSATGEISGFTCGTAYTITATNAATCSATSTSFMVQCQLAAPAVPAVTITPATCLANGTATVSNYSSTETYTSTPLGLTVSTTGVISGFTCGTAYTITATNAATCSATSTSFTVQCQLASPLVPTVSTTPATCLVNGTASVSNYSATLTYTSTPVGLTVSSTGLISGFTCGTAYTITASNAATCSVTSTSFTVDCQLATLVVPAVTTTAATCSANGTATVSNYLPGLTYTSTPTGLTVSATGVVSGFTCGTAYTITATNTATCSATSTSFTVQCQLAAPLVPTITTRAATCSQPGSSTITNYNATNTYIFTPSGPIVSSTGLISGMTAGVSYTVISEIGGCISLPSASFSINAITSIPPTFNQVTPVCQGSTINIPTSSTNTPPIVGVWNLISSTANDVTYEFTPDSGQCALPTRMTIVVHPLPTVTPSVTTQSFCSGGTTNINLLSDVPGSEFYWTATGTSVSGQSGSVTGSGATSINQTLTLNANQVAAGQVTYTIVAEANGCLGAPVTVVVTVNPIPNVIVSPVSLIETICSGGTTNISFTGAINNTVYTWSVVSSVGVSGALNGVGTSINQILTTTGLSQGTVVYEVTPSLNGCPGTPQRITVIVNPVPEIFGSATHPDLCSGRETTNILVSTFNAATVFNWVVEPNGVSGASAGTATGLSINIVQTLTTTGNVRGYVDYIITPVLTGCSGIPITVRVYVNPLPVVSLTDGTICVDAAGVPFQSYVLDSGLNDVDYDFVWTFEGNTIPGETSSTHTATQVGTYTVVATNSTTNCVSNIASAVVTATNPATSLTVTQSEYFSDNAILTVNVTGGNGTLLYQLDQGILQESNVFTGVSAGLHIITVVDTQGCTYLTLEVLVIDYPKYFTPNGDGHNDTWNIIGLNQPDAKLYIFDRYGKLLKQLSATTASEGWNGIYNNEKLPSTDYWFTLDYTENGAKKQFKAHFSLIR